MATPADRGLYMPAEWYPHDRCWMAWPCRVETFGARLEAAREAYAEIARAIAEFEPVTMIANPDSIAEASLHCGPGIACLPMAHDDSWIRDNGPSFVIDGQGGIAGIDWRFNGWGIKEQPHDRDAAVAEAVLEHLDIAREAAPLVLEGGSIHVDGEGSLLTTESCLLNPNRNPDLGRNEIEALLCAYLGVRQVIWLGQGLEDDSTGGHVDNLACFVRPGVVLALNSDDSEDGNHGALQDNLARLRAAKDAKGRQLEVVEVMQPARREHENGERLAMSYVNFYIANGGVVMPSFEDGKDAAARDTVTACFPGREVRQVPVLDVVRGGGIHCTTQQQPKALVAAAEPD